MRWLILLPMALEALRANALRSALTMLGIIIGVAAVIAMIGVGRGAQARVQAQISSLGANMMMVLPGSTTAGGLRLGSGAAQTLTEDDAQAIAAEVPQVLLAAPRIGTVGQVVAGNSNWATQIQGVTPAFFEARQWPLAAGRHFEPAELRNSGKVAILGDSTARRLFGSGITPESVLDQPIRVRRAPVTVIGVLAPKGQSVMGQDQDDVLFVPISTARNRLMGQAQGRLRRVAGIALKLHPEADPQAAMQAITALLRQRHHLQGAQEDDFTVRDLTEMLQAQEDASRTLSMLLAAVASVSLLVGGIGIMNIMLVSVTERTREIGLRMAVGARSRDILGQFLIEALTLSLIGAIAGLLLGIAAAGGIGAIAGWQIDLRPWAAVLATGFAAAVGLFFGYYPARKAAKLTPIEALRRD